MQGVQHYNILSDPQKGNIMATSPITPAEDHAEVELYTPSNIGFSKDHCQEITPDDDHKTHQTTLSVPKPNKVDKNKSLKEKGHKLSKRKLFPGQSINTISGNESACGIVEKRKKLETEGIVSDPKNSPSRCPVKLPLTERQQLAFLLEATSTQSSSDCVDDENVKEGFTKVKPRGKGKKKKMAAVNPRVYRRNERGETPLHTAAIKGDVEGMKKLINDGADVGAKDYAGWTALHEACNYGNLAVAKILLDHGAPVNTPGFEGDTPLHDAVINNHVEVADMLLTCGADFRQANTKGKSPIYFIATKEMREVFVSHGVQLATPPPPVTSSPAIGGNEIPETYKGKTVTKQSKTTHNYKGPLRGNEIQRKQTQGESKMEKPVMYMCTLTAGAWDKEIKVTTTQALCQESREKVETSEKPGVKLNAESETGISLLPNDEGIGSKNEENPLGLPKETAVSHRGVSAADGDIFEEVLEGPKDEGISVNALAQIQEPSLDHIEESSLQEEVLSTVAGEGVGAEKHSDAIIGQGETQSTFQGRLPRSQEETTPATSKDVRGDGCEGDTGGVVSDKREIFVQNSGPSDGDPKESGNPTTDGLISSGSAAAPIEFVSLCQNTSTEVEVQGIASQKEYTFSGAEIEASRKTECSTVLGLHRKDSITLESVDREGNETSSKELDVKCATKIPSQEARSLDKLVPCSTASPNQNAFPRSNKTQGPRPGHDQSQGGPRRSCKVNERCFSCCNGAVLKPKRPTITWRSLLAENKCDLKELKVPFYEQFLINTKDYELASDVTSASLQQVTAGLPGGKEKLLLKQEREKGELTRKQKSEEAKLQICMEQEIVRFYAKNAYSSLKRSPPPGGVCTALLWQNMTQQRLKIEKKKIAQNRVLESSSRVSENAFQGILDKYDKLKEVMALRHRHEQQALDAVNQREI